jgi:SNF2 family DNA or RNA helicase
MREESRVLITGNLLRNSTPVFRIEAPEDSYLARAWGGVYADGAWLFPAFYPFARWAFEDIRKFYPKASWDATALKFLQDVRDADASWAKASERWVGAATAEPVADEAFFAKGFTPYQHQMYGIRRLTTWWRSFLLWEMGTGKTRTAIDALRLLREQGKFRKALVIGPPVVLDTWRREVAKCSGGAWRAVVWDGSRKAAEAAQEADVVLASYARVRIERERALAAAKELSVTDEVRARYRMPLLAPEAREQLEWERQHPLYQLDYDTIIADESHYLGNWKSGQTQAAIELSAKAVRRYCLTGTPGDDPRKLYAQLYFLSPALIPLSYAKFEERHLVHSKKNKHVVVGFRFLNELNERVNSVASRMKKADCLDLPPVTVSDLYYDLGPKQRARYNELVMEMQTSVEPVLNYITPASLKTEELPDRAALKLPHGAARVNKLLQVLSGFLILGADYSICDACVHMEACAESRIRPYTKKCKVIQSAPERQVLRDVENPKLDLYKEQLEVILEGDATNKVIVWANFTEELDDLERATKEMGYGYVRVDGSNTNKIGEISDKFQTDENCRVYIGQVRTGIGVTLTAANYTIFYSLPWDPLQYRQAMDRNNRPGQKRDMTVYRLLSSDATWALDRYVAQVLTFKETIALTLTELIACASCDRQQHCAAKEILPFRENCKYAANVARPVADVEVIE